MWLDLLKWMSLVSSRLVQYGSYFLLHDKWQLDICRICVQIWDWPWRGHILPPPVAGQLKKIRHQVGMNFTHRVRCPDYLASSLRSWHIYCCIYMIYGWIQTGTTSYLLFRALHTFSFYITLPKILCKKVLIKAIIGGQYTKDLGHIWLGYNQSGHLLICI